MNVDSIAAPGSSVIDRIGSGSRVQGKLRVEMLRC